jgi:hypothetical protein
VFLFCAHSGIDKRLFLTSQKTFFQGLGWSSDLVGELVASYCGERGEHGAKGEKLKEEETNSLFSVILGNEVGFFHAFKGLQYSSKEQRPFRYHAVTFAFPSLIPYSTQAFFILTKPYRFACRFASVKFPLIRLSIMLFILFFLSCLG